MKLIDLMTGPWAILPDTLAELQRIYATHLRGDKIDIDAIEARLGRPLASEQQDYVVREGGVGVLSVAGVLAPKANILTRVSGGASTQLLTRQFESMRNDARVKSAVIAWDSPGGNVLGVPAAGEALRALAANKPTVSVSEGTIASAAYWIGSAANAIFVEGATDNVGSIGVVQRIGWDSKADNQIEMVRGKYKRTSINGEPPTAEMLAYHEAQLDYLYTVFIDIVAEHRGASAADVLTHMADGRVFIGRQAIDAGLVDGVSTVDAMVEQMATNPGAYARRRKAVFGGAGSSQSNRAGVAQADDLNPEKGHVMPTKADQTEISRESLERDHATLFAALQSEFQAAGAEEGAKAGFVDGEKKGADAERSRIQAVLAQGKALPGHDAMIYKLAFDGTSTAADAAVALIAAEGQTRNAAAKAHADDAPPALRPSVAPDDDAAAAATQPKTIAKRAVALLEGARNFNGGTQ